MTPLTPSYEDAVKGRFKPDFRAAMDAMQAAYAAKQALARIVREAGADARRARGVETGKPAS